MHRLSRAIRFNIHPSDGAGLNGFAGSPPTRALVHASEIEVRCLGEPDPRTGYLINIKDIDHAVRTRIIPRIAHTVRADPAVDPVALMPMLLAESASALPVAVESILWRLTPFCSLEARMRDSAVLIRTVFEFSAAHRLHVPTFSDEENRRIFGKCNNPAGHGHNYRVEPAVAVNPDSPPPPAELERVIHETIIEPFDHKHLNEQTAHFADGSGLNPSVENIARVCYDLLTAPIRGLGGHLRSVTVWETDRTSATFPIEGSP